MLLTYNFHATWPYFHKTLGENLKLMAYFCLELRIFKPIQFDVEAWFCQIQSHICPRYQHHFGRHACIVVYDVANGIVRVEEIPGRSCKHTYHDKLDGTSIWLRFQQMSMAYSPFWGSSHLHRKFKWVNSTSMGK